MDTRVSPWYNNPAGDESVAANRSKAVGRSPGGGEAMSVYEVFIIIFAAMTFVVVLVKLMVYIADIFSKRK